MGYAIAKIKNGSKCGQDFTYYTWPPSDYKDGKKLAGVKDDCVFVAEKKKIGSWPWECVAPGAGEIGKYGNGSIYVSDVEMLTPLVLFKPDLQHWIDSGECRPVIERGGE